MEDNPLLTQKKLSFKRTKNSPEQFDGRISSYVIPLTNITPVEAVDTSQLDRKTSNIKTPSNNENNVHYNGLSWLRI